MQHYEIGSTCESITLSMLFVGGTKPVCPFVKEAYICAMGVEALYGICACQSIATFSQLSDLGKHLTLGDWNRHGNSNTYDHY